MPPTVPGGHDRRHITSCRRLPQGAERSDRQAHTVALDPRFAAVGWCGLNEQFPGVMNGTLNARHGTGRCRQIARSCLARNPPLPSSRRFAKLFGPRGSWTSTMTVHNSLANRSERDGKRGRASGVEFRSRSSCATAANVARTVRWDSASSRLSAPRPRSARPKLKHRPRERRLERIRSKGTFHRVP